MVCCATRRNFFILTFWAFISINLIYFLRRSLMSDTCSVVELLKKMSSSATLPAANSNTVNSRNSIDQVGHKENSGSAVRMTTLLEDEFEQCEKTHESLYGIVGANVTSILKPTWCMYKDEVDLRIIILTYNRYKSLLKILNSISDLDLDGASVALEIWIDCTKKTNAVDANTVSAARSFQWRHGPVNVHVRRQHAGIYGQWIYTWRPRSTSTKEMALILEDDLTLSPFAYRWLRAARRFYDNRDDVAGLTLQSEGLILATTGRPLTRPPAKDGAAFLYALIGSWGFAPTPSVWTGFQDWFHQVRAQKNFSPLVPGLLMSRWYRSFEKSGKADTMWTMWFIYYCAVVRESFTIYNNIPNIAKQLQMPGSSCLSVNRRESGLHFHGKGIDNAKLLLTTWNDEFINFRKNLTKFDFGGKRV